MKKNIAVFFGGNSPERDISVITGVQAMSRLDRSKYEVFPIFADGYGFKTGADFDKIETFAKKKEGLTAAFDADRLLVKKRGKFKTLAKIDCALLCTHGACGENGGLQGYLETTGIPYTSCGVEASAVCMNKLTTKKIVANLKIKQVPYVFIRAEDFAARPEKTVAAIIKKLPLPLIVKPSSLGSSIGIAAAESEDELAEALAVAAEYDDNIVVEKRLEDFVEVNCAAVKIDGEICVSAIEKPLGWQTFLSFSDKYENGGKLSGLSRELPARLDAKQNVEVRDITRRIYAELGLAGVIRADYLIDKEGAVFLNEINTIPGSLAFYLFEEVGVSYTRLLDALIDGAAERKRNAERLKVYYPSSVLENFKSGGKCGNKLQK